MLINVMRLDLVGRHAYVLEEILTDLWNLFIEYLDKGFRGI